MTESSRTPLRGDIAGAGAEVDAPIVYSTTRAAAHGHAAESLALAANVLGARGSALEPGWLVRTGRRTDAVSAEPGVRIAAHFTNLASAALDGGRDAPR